MWGSLASEERYLSTLNRFPPPPEREGPTAETTEIWAAGAAGAALVGSAHDGVGAAVAVGGRCEGAGGGGCGAGSGDARTRMHAGGR